jgi:Phosphotransferase enzyme family
MPQNTLPPQADSVRNAAERLAYEPGVLKDQLNKAWMAWNGRADSVAEVVVERIHYKPMERARLVVQVKLNPLEKGCAWGHQILHLQIYANPQTPRQRRSAYLQKPTLPSAGPPVFLLDAFQAVGFSLPNGPRLRKLNDFLDPVDFAALLRFKRLDEWADDPGIKRLELVRYVPRKRVLLRLTPENSSLGGIYIKLFGINEFRTARRNQARILTAAREGHLRFRVPSLLARSKKRRALFLAEIPGRRYTDFFGNQDLALAERVGKALASLHTAPLHSKTKSSSLREWKALEVASLDLLAALPELQLDLHQLLKRLAKKRRKFPKGESCPVHANLFGDQILVDGEAIGMVDWDDLSSGEASFDLGRLIAHMLYQEGCASLQESKLEPEIRSLLQGYRLGGGRPFLPQRLEWHIACALPLRAKISALRMLPPEWPQKIQNSCLLARDILKNGMDAVVES